MLRLSSVFIYVRFSWRRSPDFLNFLGHVQSFWVHARFLIRSKTNTREVWKQVSVFHIKAIMQSLSDFYSFFIPPIQTLQFFHVFRIVIMNSRHHPPPPLFGKILVWASGFSVRKQSPGMLNTYSHQFISKRNNILRNKWEKLQWVLIKINLFWYLNFTGEK